MSEARTKLGNGLRCAGAGACFTGSGTCGTATASTGMERCCSIGGVAVAALLEAAMAPVI